MNTKTKLIKSDVEKFLKSGNKITKVEPEVRAMPEFVWWKDEYPKRQYRRRRNKNV